VATTLNKHGVEKMCQISNYKKKGVSFVDVHLKFDISVGMRSFGDDAHMVQIEL
jgi:predicted flap endonuclease-1-like 5' DNA nuclease